MEKIKQFITSEKGKDILVIFIVILVGLSSFGLGRLSKSSTSSGIKIEYSDRAISQEANVLSSQAGESKVNSSGSQTSSKTFFASSRGSKYYSLGCSGGKTIKQENRVYFSTAQEAEQAGYELSVSCK